MSKQILKNLFKLQVPALQIPPVDGEILYTTNNVCIHPQLLLSNAPAHHSGFLSISAKVEDSCLSLVLHWNPNNKFIDLESPVSEPLSSLARTSPDGMETVQKSFDSENSEPVNFSTKVEVDTGSQATISSSDTEYADGPSRDASDYEDNIDENQTDLDEKSKTNTVENNDDKSTMNILSSSNLAFNGHVIRPPRNEAYSAFTLNLGEMRSLGVYFRNTECTKGEFIIASHESQYKALHFHHGGLDCVAKVLQEWKASLSSFRSKNSELSIRFFTLIKANLTVDELHPEEGMYQSLSKEMWNMYRDEFGRVQEELNVHKAVFFGGVHEELRPEVWPYLLKYYNYDMTVLEKGELRAKKLNKYEMINAKRENIVQLQENESFWRNVICSIEKDVLRTDRSKPYFKGEGNPNLQVLQRILLNYAVYTKTAYTQGMSDLLAPLLIEVGDESDVFWCFVGLMQHTIFISSPSDHDMEKQLLYLRELLRIIVPDFYKHLLTCGPGAMELLFAHRWILLCFKREFPEDEALKIWEACWAHYQNNYFHLFVCVAIIMIYGSDITTHKLASDEILLHFTHLALQMNGALILRKARGLLHAFRMRSTIPCTLHDLCCKENHQNSVCMLTQPKVKCCLTEDCGEGCPYGGSSDNIANLFKVNMNKLFIQKK